MLCSRRSVGRLPIDASVGCFPVARATQVPIEGDDDAGPGETVVAVGLKRITTDDTVVLHKGPLQGWTLPSIAVPQPVFSQSFAPVASSKAKELADALAIMARDDPSLKASKCAAIEKHLTRDTRSSVRFYGSCLREPRACASISLSLSLTALGPSPWASPWGFCRWVPTPRTRTGRCW